MRSASSSINCLKSGIDLPNYTSASAQSAADHDWLRGVLIQSESPI
jgi:hypothetical protein